MLNALMTVIVVTAIVAPLPADAMVRINMPTVRVFTARGATVRVPTVPTCPSCSGWPDSSSSGHAIPTVRK
jgi:hypothetical protein